jgi:hypothetical protein
VPLPLGALKPREDWKAPEWEGFGFPTAHAEGLTLTGTVDSAAAQDARYEGAPSHTALQLFCQQGGSGDSALSGVSGAAVIVGGRACGVIYWAPVPLNERVVFATPISAIAKKFLSDPAANGHPILASALRELPTVHLDRFDVSLGAYLSKFQKLRLRTGSRQEQASTDQPDEVFAWQTIRPLAVNSTIDPDCEIGSEVPSPEQTPLESAFSLALAKKRRHLFFFGQAGVGKSTLLRQFARSAWHSPATVGLPCRHLPLLARLQSISSCSQCHLEPLLDQSSEVRLSVPPPEGFLEEWHSRTGAPWLLLFDGLDEVPEPLLSRTIERLFSFVEEDGPWTCVFTSRFFPARSVTA